MDTKCTKEEASAISLDEYQSKYFPNEHIYLNSKPKIISHSVNTDAMNIDEEELLLNSSKDSSLDGLVIDEKSDLNETQETITSNKTSNETNISRSYVNWRLLPQNAKVDKEPLIPPLVPIYRREINHQNNRRTFNNRGGRNGGRRFNNDNRPYYYNTFNRKNNTNQDFMHNQRNRGSYDLRGRINQRQLSYQPQLQLPQLMPLMNVNTRPSCSGSGSALGMLKMLTPSQSHLQPNLGSFDMSTIAETMLLKLDQFHEMAQSIKVAEEKRTKYNLPIQKEIAALQNKTLIVKCSTQEVVTFDGPGLTDCEPIINSTPLSMNMRFS